MDENHGRFLFLKLQNEGRLGTQVVSVGQGPRLSEAYKFIEILVAHKRLRHDGHPILAWNVGNAEPHENRNGARWIEKPEGQPKKRVDGTQAMAMSIAALMALPSRRPSIGAMVV
jgi:phage terminase large subunit-like protein